MSAGTGDRYAAVSTEWVYRALRDHPRWVVERDRLYLDLRLPSFRAAIEFVDRVADIAERVGHHPNILVHEWCFVHLELYSHAGKGLSRRDVELAVAIDAGVGELEEIGDG